MGFHLFANSKFYLSSKVFWICRVGPDMEENFGFLVSMWRMANLKFFCLIIIRHNPMQEIKMTPRDIFVVKTLNDIPKRKLLLPVIS